MNTQPSVEAFDLRPIGFISSRLEDLKDCPLQGAENAPEVYLEIYEPYTRGIKDIAAGDELCIVTWLHLADRNTVQCYKRNRVGSEEFGVFSTRSPDRPNPIVMHTVTVLEIVDAHKIKIYPMEALNGTPVVDIKPLI